MSLKNLFIVTICLFVFSRTMGQGNYDQNNHIGLSGGLTLFDINTSNFVTEQGSGYMFSLNTRGAFYNDFDLIYGINFTQSDVGILARDFSAGSNFQEEFVDYTLSGVQVKLLASYNIIYPNLSIEFGPLLSVNGKLKLKREDFEDHILEGYQGLRAKDIQDVSRVNARLVAGVTAGLENFRVSAQYQYGATNLFGRLNDVEDIEKAQGTFQGNTSTIIFAVHLYL